MNAQPEEKPEGAPEWMVSYADMITIMMSFFVIMFAIASGEAAKGKKDKKQQAVVDSIQSRFGPNYQPFANWSAGAARKSGSASNASDKGNVRLFLPSDEKGTVRVVRKEHNRIRLPGQGERRVIGDVVFFDDTSAKMGKEQLERLQGIAEEMVGKVQQIEIVGHTSARPLPAGSPHQDRWELAYTQCRHVAKQLEQLKIEPERIRISVIQSTEPLPTGDAPAAQAEDQRVDVYLTDKPTESLSRGRQTPTKKE